MVAWSSDQVVFLSQAFCLSFLFPSTSHSQEVSWPSLLLLSRLEFLLTGFLSCYSHEGNSPTPAALSAAEDLINHAVQNGYLSPQYIQPLLLKEETCLIPQHSEMPKKGKAFSPVHMSLHCPQLHLGEFS